MDDRELLEAAARAADIDAEFHSELGYGPEGMWLKGQRSPDNSKYWNPLNDDGDALRLAVSLGITIDLVDKSAYRRDPHGNLVQEYWGGDYPACYRHAIVRAAAQIGKRQ